MVGVRRYTMFLQSRYGFESGNHRPAFRLHQVLLTIRTRMLLSR